MRWGAGRAHQGLHVERVVAIEGRQRGKLPRGGGQRRDVLIQPAGCSRGMTNTLRAGSAWQREAGPLSYERHHDGATRARLRACDPQARIKSATAPAGFANSRRSRAHCRRMPPHGVGRAGAPSISAGHHQVCATPLCPGASVCCSRVVSLVLRAAANCLR